MNETHGTATTAVDNDIISVRDSALSLHEERAIELAHLLGGDYTQVIQAMATSLMPGMRPGARVDQLIAAVTEAAPEDELNHWAAELYMSVYTLDEIEQLLVFHRSPIGRRHRELAPAVMAACGVQIQRIISTRLQDALIRHGLV